MLQFCLYSHGASFEKCGCYDKMVALILQECILVVTTYNLVLQRCHNKKQNILITLRSVYNSRIQRAVWNFTKPTMSITENYMTI